MNEYKCISCNFIRKSENICSCAECGGRMFPTPYNRKSILIDEIQGFINALFFKDFDDKCFVYYRTDDKKLSNKTLKSQDDVRFPCFEKILNYICSANSTEEFIERLNNTIEQIEKYICTPYKMEYLIDFTPLYKIIQDYDDTMEKAACILGESIEIEKINFDEVRVIYSEILDKELIPSVKELISSLKDLVEKIYTFIKYNNMYGVEYCKYSIHKPEQRDKPVDVSVIAKMQKSVCATIERKYQVDIFSDGTEELQEILQEYWNVVGMFINVHVLTKKYCYEYKNENLSEEQFKQKLMKDINARYLNISNSILSLSYLDDKTENELFTIYNKMIEIDSFGFMGVKRTQLLMSGVYEEILNNLIGLSTIKESVKKIKAFAVNNKNGGALNLHMCFYGNPGTGKTEVARIIAGILYENKILPRKDVVEVSREDLVGQYVGETSQKTSEKIREAMGGVLFIDEAYSLVPKEGNFDYGHEAVATLVKAMEDNRGKFCVILAGYKNQMIDMISTNPGFKSRIQFELEFPNYSRKELNSIANLMLEERKYTLSEDAMRKILDITDVKRREPNFANAREVRNILDGVIMCQNLRTMDADDKELGLVDVNKYIEDTRIHLSTVSGSSEMLTAEEELDNLVGLESVKRMVKKIKAFAKKNKNEPDFNMHMCFYGNPGTGKTEVARIISSILYNAGVLAEAKLVETDSHGLIGEFIGETAPKTQTKISGAMGGVLFVDEAYGLTNEGGNGHNYGDEAIEVLLKNMEDHRGKFCVILAGYKDEMKSMLKSNPGIESRIQFSLEFPDYSREELGQIAVRFLEKKKYEIDSSALELLLDVAEYYRNQENFANARTVRNILDQVIMNQNLRTEDSENDDRTIIKADVEDYLYDEGISVNDSSGGTLRIGFMG